MNIPSSFAIGEITGHQETRPAKQALAKQGFMPSTDYCVEWLHFPHCKCNSCNYRRPKFASIPQILQVLEREGYKQSYHRIKGLWTCSSHKLYQFLDSIFHIEICPFTDRVTLVFAIADTDDRPLGYSLREI